MTQVDAVKIWLEGADDAWDTAQKLMLLKKNHHALFFAQLYLEKLLKALTYHLKDDHPLFTHDLVLLVAKLEIQINQAQIEDLREISKFNVSARYDEIKRGLYKKATPEFTKIWIQKVKDLAIYFRKML
ncbi:HEPN domain-containing protein [Candidatus Amesbacteria bacterium]|nr:HEPN domain-containing protein [Candidatus Amesbacteria bacterium]